MVLVSDESGSMAATDVLPTRLAAAERAANTFIDQLPSDARVGAIAFSSAPNAVQAPSVNHGAARALIDGQTAGGATATGDALELALELLHGSQVKHPASAIVLLSDGAANAGINVITVARQAAAEQIPIYTVALGTPSGTLPNPEPFEPPLPVPPDPQLMEQIAQASHGRSFDAQTADQLASIYSASRHPPGQHDPQTRGDGGVRDRRGRSAACCGRDLEPLVASTPVTHEPQVSADSAATTPSFSRLETLTAAGSAFGGMATT